jgi:GNAT superfamily N-acetyltransferase
MDSWLEDNLLFKATLYKLMRGNTCIGYAALLKKTLQFFHVRKEYFRYAPALFEKFIAEKAVKKVFVISQDSLLCALIAEWEYKKVKQACFFTDSRKGGDTDTTIDKAVFRTAVKADVKRIREISGKYFDDKSCGFSCMEERIAAGMIFVLENKRNLLGCGIIEKGMVHLDCVSIGMFVNRDFRGKGYATAILLKLKEWAYQHDLKPIAGCWYYNTLSRKSLEAAGMIATSIGFEAVLKGKEKLPLRTGNPPGELVEEK